jgi:hypothetical protein
MVRAPWHIGRVDILWEQALAWRMQRHYLVEHASPDDLVVVFDRLRGLHAQVTSSVVLALWVRINWLEQDFATWPPPRRSMSYGWCPPSISGSCVLRGGFQRHWIRTTGSGSIDYRAGSPRYT